MLFLCEYHIYFDVFELKINFFQKIDPDFLSMENVISKPFDKIIKFQLESVWNQIGSKPKQLISDCKTLRLLLHYLCQYDCITFFKMLQCLK